MIGKCKDGLTPSGVFFWVDVRDVALAHVKAMEVPAAANKRFFVTAGYYSNKEIAEIVRDSFPELASKVPEGDALKPGDYPTDGLYKYDNSRTVEVLGVKFRSLKESIVDTAKSLQAVQTWVLDFPGGKAHMILLHTCLEKFMAFWLDY